MQKIKKVSIFVDVQNIYYTTKQEFNLNFDYNKFWKLVTHNREVIGAFASMLWLTRHYNYVSISLK